MSLNGCECLATAGCRAVLKDGRAAAVVFPVYQGDSMLTVCLQQAGEPWDGTWGTVPLDTVVEFLPAEGPDCSTGGGRRH